jgi:hypothetical protein
MSRKQTLINTVKQHLERDNQGLLKTRQHRLFAMTRIVHDLFSTGIVPQNWHLLKTKDIHALVAFWQKKGLKAATIMNYLIHFRYFLNKINHPLDNIDNQSLNLSKIRNPVKPTINEDALLQAINEPIAYVLFALQVKFGLTLLEAMRLKPDVHVLENELWVTREISTNHKDRLIPIISEEQKTLLIQFNTVTEGNKCLEEQFGDRHLRLAYKFALSTLQLPTNLNYRYVYAKARFTQLHKSQSKREAKSMVFEETHINKTNPLWTNIHE